MSDRLLRNALALNGLFSALSGVILLVAATPLAGLIAPQMPSLPLQLLGLGLLGYAAGLWWQSRRSRLSIASARLAVVLDDAWVIASLVLLLGFPELLSATGKAVVAIVAAVVAAFAIAQYAGVRRIARAAAG